MSSTPNTKNPQSSGESSNSRPQTEPTNTHQAVESSPDGEDTEVEDTLNAELQDFIKNISPTTARMRRRRRDANLAELKQLLSMSPDTTHDQLHAWLLDNLSVLAHCHFNRSPDPTTFVEHGSGYTEPKITNRRAREITERILTIVSVTEWPNDQEMKDALASCQNPDDYLARRKHIKDPEFYPMWKQFASNEFKQALKEFKGKELEMREQRPQSLLRNTELAYPESSEAGSSDEKEHK